MPRNLYPRLRPPWPGPEVVEAGLGRLRFVRLRLERFQRGVDNLHIDVALGPVLTRAANAYVASRVRENVRLLWKQPVSAYGDAVLESFGRVLQEHHRSAVGGARQHNRLERVQLFQLAVLKLLLHLVDLELNAVRLELQDARNLSAPQSSGKSLQLHQQAVILGRHAGQLRFRVAKQVIRELMRIERGGMCRLRKQQLGLSWPVAEFMLTNPILQLDGVGGCGDFSAIYPALLHDLEVSCRISRCVMRTFAALLPEHVDADLAMPAAGQPLLLVDRRDQGVARGFVETERRVRHLLGQQELSDCSSTWLDLPDNAIALLGGVEADWPRPGNWRHPGIGRLQRDLNKRLATRLNRAGLMHAVVASYELSALYPLLGLVDAEALIFDFLQGTVSRREMLRRLGGVVGAAEPGVVLRRIEELRKEYNNSPAAGRRQVVARLGGDFLRLRRDLKLAWQAYVGMDSLRLLTDERELSSSRANNTLQVFGREDLAVDPRGSVVGHVIIRADIRGGDTLVEQMRQCSLNAAAHFSRYLYDPLGRLLERFDAQKVAVQGDVLIFSILEYGGDGCESRAVARACCVATGLLDLAGTLNAENERLGLRRIELGLGIAYADESPTYLHDHGHTVTLSPAIGRSGRLAACHTLLRGACEFPAGRGLCVATSVREEDPGGRLGEELIRCNVNGIEIDAAAFAQLNVEIRLRRFSIRNRRGGRATVLHAGSCPDVTGENHRLVVNEQPVRLWLGRQLLDAVDDGRRYFEVVTDTRLLDRVREKLSPGGGNLAETAPGVRQ